jgi:alpha-1,6-mannosyltransferase
VSLVSIVRGRWRAQSFSTSAHALWWLGAIGLALAVLTVLTPFAFRAGGDNAYMALTIPAGLLTILAMRVAANVPITRALVLILGLAIALRGFATLLDPFLSSDVYRYVWDGKVQAAGINPYRYIPEHDALAPLRDTENYPHINRAHYAVTIYPPVAQIFFFVVTRIGESVTVMRLALLLSDAMTILLIILLLRRMERPLTHVVGYAWHPLPIWEIGNAGHVDALMVALMMFGLWLALTGRPLRAATAIALGALVKPLAWLALPAVWRPWDWRLPCLVLVISALCYAPYLSVGSGVFGFLTTGYLDEHGFASGESIWPLAAWRLIFGTHAGDVIAYFAFAALTIGAMAFSAARQPVHMLDLRIAEIKRLLLAFLFLFSPVYPWYFLIVVPFVSLSGGAPVWTASIGALLLQEEVASEPYIPPLARKSVLYVAFLLACAYSLWAARRRRIPEGDVIKGDIAK